MDPASMQIPSTFWRVSAKALIYDEQSRLLVFMNKNEEWEMPGGGWEHDETFEQCIVRELDEEAKIGVEDISDVVFCYPGKTRKGLHKISIVVQVIINDAPITPTDDGLVASRFVNKEEFLELPFEPGESVIKEYVDHIWP